MSCRTGVFLQVRLGSTRLPGKALYEIEGKPLITHAMESLKCVEADIHLLLTDYESLSRLSGPAASAGFGIFAGSADDVLDRYVSAANEYDTGTVIRATGDNPLVDAGAAALILDEHLKTGADYSAFDFMPLGTGVEVLKVESLQKAVIESDEPYDHEHVSPYLYKNPEIFMINRIPAPEELRFAEGSVTVDTADDFEYIRMLYSALYQNRPLRITDIIPWLKQNRRPY